MWPIIHCYGPVRFGMLNEDDLRSRHSAGLWTGVKDVYSSTVLEYNFEVLVLKIDDSRTLLSLCKHNKIAIVSSSNGPLC